MPESRKPVVVERFTPTIGRWWGVVGLVLLGLAVVSVLSTDSEPTTIAIAAGLGLAMVLTWAALVRPTARAYDDHLLLRNVLTDTRVPWARITDVDVGQTLLVYCGSDRHTAVGIGKSARYQLRGSKGGLGGGALIGGSRFEALGDQPTLTGADVTAMHYSDYVVVRIDGLRRQQVPVEDGLAEVRRSVAWHLVAVLAAVAAVLVVALAL